MLGNVLYVSSNFSDFSQGFLFGLGIGLNVIGIILVFVYLAREGKKDRYINPLIQENNIGADQL